MDQHARITIFSLGGTIAMGSSTGGPVAPALSAADLLAAVPGLDRQSVDLQTRDFRKIPGGSLTFADLISLHEAIAGEFASGVDGVVVTQGTDTIEETAYLLHLLHAREEPIVVTGAMRHPGLAGADGPANLLAAVQTAASPTSRGHGCLVVLHDEIHSARHVAKTHTTATSAFTSHPAGPAGTVVEGQPTFFAPPATQITIDGITSETGRVGLVTATLGDDGHWISKYATEFDGLVVAGFGVGHVPMGWADTLEKVACQVPVVLASRIAAGPVLSSTYGFVGSESDLLKRGLVGAGSLGPYKARILLSMLLASGADRAAIATTFAKV